MSEYNSGNKGKYSGPSYPGFPFLCCQSPAVNHGLKVLGGKFQNETIHTFKTAHHFDKWNKIWHCPPSSCLHGNHPLSSVSRLHMFPVHQSLVAASFAPRPQCGRACVHGTLICLNGPKAQGQWCRLDTAKRSYEMLPFHEKYVCIGEKVTQYASCSVLSILLGTTGGLGTYALWMGGGGVGYFTQMKAFPWISPSQNSQCLHLVKPTLGTFKSTHTSRRAGRWQVCKKKSTFAKSITPYIFKWNYVREGWRTRVIGNVNCTNRSIILSPKSFSPNTELYVHACGVMRQIMLLMLSEFLNEMFLCTVYLIQSFLFLL